MYARRLKLMEAFERKIAPLEEYHLDVVGLGEDTRGEIAFLRKKLGISPRPVAASEQESHLHKEAKEVEEGEVGAEDHGPETVLSPLGQEIQRPTEQAPHPKPDTNDSSRRDAPHRTRTRFLPNFFRHSSPHRGRDITPARLQMIRKAQAKPPFPPAPQPKPSRGTPTVPSSPRRRLSKASRQQDPHQETSIHNSDDTTMTNTFKNASAATPSDEGNLRLTDLYGSSMVEEW
ncbi:MAG: hypothetical protein L6R39_005121, partial [Caloplaca ligustica]